jgi:hypothetical protein
MSFSVRLRVIDRVIRVPSIVMIATLAGAVARQGTTDVCFNVLVAAPWSRATAALTARAAARL